MIVVQMQGLPGSGKSAVARALGPQIGAVVLDKDIIKSALLRTGATEELAAPAAYDVYFALADNLVEQGHSLILDNPVFWPRVEQRWLELCARAGVTPLLIECVCADNDELRRRLAARERLESHPDRPLDLAHYPGAAPTTYEPRLRLDTTRPLDACVAEALAYVRGHLAANASAATAGARA